jgi:hypothetical protein
MYTDGVLKKVEYVKSTQRQVQFIELISMSSFSGVFLANQKQEQYIIIEAVE